MSFNPKNTISGNGISGQVVATYTTGSSYWNVVSQSLPGNANAGSFPNGVNPYSIQSNPLNLTWPYRGGKNIPSSILRNTYNTGTLGISSIGVALLGSNNGVSVYGNNGTLFHLDTVACRIRGEDTFGGNVDSRGLYAYHDSTFIDHDAWGNISGTTWYGGSYTQLDGHSKIIGWAKDGYPIYGPFGYVNPLSTTSGVTRMISGYQISLNPNRPVDKLLVVSTTSTNSTEFSVYSSTGIGIGMDLSGPDVPAPARILGVFGRTITMSRALSFPKGAVITASYSTGAFVEDNVYNATTSTALDVYNGRFCVTPEYPEGTYAYFLTEDVVNGDLVPTYPYIIGPSFYGSIIPDSTDSRLSNIVPSDGTISPAFSSTVTNYTVTVSNTTTDIYFLLSLSTQTSTVVFNTTTLFSGVTAPVSLIVGNNPQTIKVTSQFLTTTTYNLNVVRVKSPIKNLTNLTISSGTLSPSFASTVTSYSFTVDSTKNFLDITATKEDSLSSLTINGVPAFSGVPSRVNLNYGISVIPIIVTAEDLTTKSYTLNVTRLSNISLLSSIETDRGPITPVFSNNTFLYNINVSNSTTNIRVKASTLDNLSTLKVNGTALTAGQYSSPLTLAVGVNGITLNVTSSDQSTDHFYRLNVLRDFSSTATLSSLLLSSGALSPSFTPSGTNYTVALPNSVTSISVTPTASQADATIKVNGSSVLSGRSSNSIPVDVGANLIAVEVTAQNGINVKNYNIIATRAGSAISTLSNLLVSHVSIVPNFSPTVYNYTATVSYGVVSTNITPYSSDSNSTIKVNNVSILSGAQSSTIPLLVGTNTIRTVVVSQNLANTSTYTVSIRRKANYDASLLALIVNIGTLDPDFDPAITEYYVTEPFGVQSLDFTIYANDTNVSSIKISNGVTEITTSSGSTTTIPLFGSVVNNEWNGNTTVTVSLVAADRESTQTYTVNVTRLPNFDSSLSGLFISTGSISPVFSPGTTSYYVAVPNTVTTASIRAITSDPLSKIFVNTNLVESNQWSPPVNLYVGNNTIPILVYAADKKSVTGYNIFVVRASSDLSDNALLSDITLSTGSYIPLFSPNVFAYSSYVPYETNTVKIGIKKQQSNSVVKIKGENVVSGGYSSAISIPPGTSVVPVVVTAQDTVTQNTYNITFVKQGSTDSSLKDLLVSAGQLDKPFSSKITQYSVTVPYDTVSVSVKPIVNNEQAEMNLDGVGIVRGRWATPVNIHTGSNVLSILVRAGDFIHESIYQVNFIKPITPIVPVIPPGPTPSAKPVWRTPAGFIVTATEGISISRTIQATGGGISYRLITGSLPNGLSLNTSTGVISGLPALVYQTITSKFIVRAQNTYGVSDRNFYIDVRGATPPVIYTPGPAFAIGPSGEPYIVNNQFVDFQFQASTDVLPEGKKIIFFIEDGDGELPPGLTITEQGRLYGQVKDNLRLFYKAATNGKYDQEGYDSNPYEHESSQQIGVSDRYINKIYNFALSASNGVGVVKANYKIEVYDPASFIPQNLYPVPPQWITPSDLGTVRSNSFQNIALETYDCDPGGGIITYDTFAANNGDESVLPPGLIIDRVTGVLHGYIRYTPVYTTTYTFNVRVEKRNIITNTTQVRLRTFRLTVLGAVLSTIKFETDSFVGTLNQGDQSELSIKAIHTDPNLGITYSLLSGLLPPGLSLGTDGAIQGTVAYNTTSTVAVNYAFVVKAIDNNLTGAIDGTFRIKVLPYQGKQYTKLLLRPLLSIESRSLFTNFISDQTIFEPTSLYRPYDPAFGVQQTLEFVLEYGLEQKVLRTYASAMQNNYFARKKLQFGEVKSAFALDDKGNKLYEVVYVEIIDNLVNSEGTPVSSAIEQGIGEIYPNSIDNMRASIEDIASYDTSRLPKFMRTIQDSSGIPLGRILCMPLCYCLPGKSKLVMNKIANSGMDFKQINFDLDRIIVVNSLDNTTDKYLLFPNRGVLL